MGVSPAYYVPRRRHFGFVVPVLRQLYDEDQLTAMREVDALTPGSPAITPTVDGWPGAAAIRP